MEPLDQGMAGHHQAPGMEVLQDLDIHLLDLVTELLLGLEVLDIQTWERLLAMEPPVLQDMHLQLLVTVANLDQAMAVLRCSSRLMGLRRRIWGLRVVTHQRLHSHHLDVPLDCNTSPWLTSC